YCNVLKTSAKILTSLDSAGVSIIHVGGKKPQAADNKITLDLHRFERQTRPPATVVLISGDIDFVGALSDLKYHAGYNVVVIHNQFAKQELIKIANEHFDWSSFTKTSHPEVISRTESLSSLHAQQEAPPRLLKTRAVASQKRAHSCSNSPQQLMSIQFSECPPSSTQIRKSNSQESLLQNPHLYKCPKCPRKYQSSFERRQHQQQQGHMYKCYHCPSLCYTKRDLKQHKKKQNHPADEVRQKGEENDDSNYINGTILH
ncbi:unnamed protein product, partial [Didymodactylos carnosus]